MNASDIKIARYISDQEKLFDKWDLLSQKLRSYNAIIQNIDIISEEALSEWNQNVLSTLSKFEILKEEIIKYIMKTNLDLEEPDEY